MSLIDYVASAHHDSLVLLLQALHGGEVLPRVLGGGQGLSLLHPRLLVLYVSQKLLQLLGGRQTGLLSTQRLLRLKMNYCDPDERTALPHQ